MKSRCSTICDLTQPFGTMKPGRLWRFCATSPTTIAQMYVLRKTYICLIATRAATSAAKRIYAHLFIGTAPETWARSGRLQSLRGKPCIVSLRGDKPSRTPLIDRDERVATSGEAVADLAADWREAGFAVEPPHPSWRDSAVSAEPVALTCRRPSGLPS